MAAGYNRKWRRNIRRPRKPHPKNKHEVDRMSVAEIWPFEVSNMAAGRHLGFDPTGNGVILVPRFLSFPVS